MKTLDQIRTALKKSEFYLEYMPTITLKNDACCGAEALIRWEHAGRAISPLEYIPTIENTELSGTLTYWVIEEVGREMRSWLQTTNNVHIAINVPPETIGRGGLRHAAEKAGLMDVADKLILEITERGFPDDMALQALQQEGLPAKIAIDDYGTGDANLMQLSQMNASIIKMDKYFVDQIKEDQIIPKIIKGFVACALAMDHEVIAEGVESEIQMSVLRDLGVQMAQGWYFSKPLKVNAFLEFYDKHKFK